jgi:hypothetical protein
VPIRAAPLTEKSSASDEYVTSLIWKTQDGIDSRANLNSIKPIINGGTSAVTTYSQRGGTNMENKATIMISFAKADNVSRVKYVENRCMLEKIPYEMRRGSCIAVKNTTNPNNKPIVFRSSFPIANNRGSIMAKAGDASINAIAPAINITKLELQTALILGMSAFTK